METCRHSNSDEKISSNTAGKNSQKRKKNNVNTNYTNTQTLIQTIRIYSQHIGVGFCIEKYSILIMRSKKRQIAKWIKLPNHGSIRTHGEKKYKYLGVLKASNQTNGDKRTNKKNVFQTNQKASRNQALQHWVHQRDKQRGCTACNIIRAVLEMDEGRISTNGPEDKKTHENAWGLTPERCYIVI